MTRRDALFHKSRTALPFTQAELARLLGVHPVTVSKWARGVLTPDPRSVELVLTIATGWKWSGEWDRDEWRTRRAPGRPERARFPALAYWRSVRRAIAAGDRGFALFLALWPRYNAEDPPRPDPDG
jgi:transcriptional regulator with XRE-family HTH domain